MRPVAPLVLSLLLASSLPVAAQVNPTQMRSGCVAFTSPQGYTSTPLIVVPSGNRLVLTDLTLARVNPTAPIPTSTTNAVRVAINVGGTTPVTRWLMGDRLDPADPPLQMHWSTGIVFEPDEVAEIAITVVNGPIPFATACWSGYLVPTTTTSVVPGPPASGDLALEATPNPSRESTALRFTLDRKQRVTVGVFAVDGRLVRTLHRGVLEAGEHRLAWDGRDDAGRLVASGMYFAELETSRGRATRRLARVQ